MSDQTAPVARRARAGFWERFPGPVFVKDAAMAGRRAGTYWIRGSAALLMLGIASVSFFAATDRWDTSAAAALQRYQTIAPALTATVAWFCLVVGSLCSIVFAAPSICQERRAGTLSALLTTPLKSWHIITGKLAAVASQLLVLLLIPLPLLAAVRIFGGVSMEAVFAVGSLVISLCALAASLAMLMSVRARTAGHAAAGAFLLLLLVQFIVPITLGILAATNVFVTSPNLLAASSTPFALAFATISLVLGEDKAMPTWAWVAPAGMNMLLALLFSVWAMLSLRAVMRREGEGRAAAAPVEVPRTAPAGPDLNQPPASATESVGAPIANKPRRRRHHAVRGQSRVVGDQPVLWRELRIGLVGKPTLIATYSVVGLLLGLIYFFTPLAKEADFHRMVMFIGLSIMVILAVFTSAGSLAAERESRSLDVLLSTPMSAASIVLAKFLGALRRQWMLPLIIGVDMLVATVFGGCDILTLVFAALIVLPALALICAVGTLAGVLCHRTSKATVLNVIFFGFLWGGLPLFLAILGDRIGRMDGLSIAALINPMAHGIVAVKRSYAGGFQVFDLYTANAFEYLLTLMGYALVLSLGAVASLAAAAWRVAQESQRPRPFSSSSSAK